MNRLSRLLLNILLGASVAFILASTQPLELFLISVLGSLMFIGSRCCSFERFSLSCAAACGVLLPLIPWVGPAPLITLVLLHRMITQSSDPENRVCGRWALPLLAYGFGSVVGEVSHALALTRGGASFLHGLVVDSPARVMDVWRALSEVHAHSSAWCVHLLAASFVVDFFNGEPLRRRFFTRALFYATGMSALFALMQWLGVIPFSLPNQTSFWTSIQRVSGLMSDPNALGVVMGLSLWCLALASVELKTGMGVIEALWVSLVVMAGVVSGSRTFLLACAILTIALTWHLSRRFFLAVLGSGVAVICAVTAIDLYSPLLEQLQAHSSAPEGIKRGVLSLSLLRISQTFASRTLFLDLATHLIEGHTIFGIGAERFRDYVPLVGVQSGLVKGWTDNANNLYVGLVVEVGVVGLLLFVVSLANRERSAFGRVPLATAVLWGLAALMMTGPHIDFPEVLIIVAFLIGATTLERQVAPPRRVALAAVAAILGFYASTTREQGVFGWHESAGVAERWLSNHATIQLECKHSGDGVLAQASTRLRAMYVPQRAPLEVQVIRGARITQRLLFSRAQDEQELQFACEHNERQLEMTLITVPPWSPYRAWPEQSGDRRILGVQQVELPRP